MFLLDAARVKLQEWYVMNWTLLPTLSLSLGLPAATRMGIASPEEQQQLERLNYIRHRQTEEL